AWPDEEWWLAVNPGLPIEGYLPAWFVSQVAQGMTTVPGEPARPEQHPGEQSFAAMAHSDPFANPTAPAPPAPDPSLLPPAPHARPGHPPPPAAPVPERPPPARRARGRNHAGSGPVATVPATAGARLPLRQPPRGAPPAPSPGTFGEESLNPQPPASALPEQP